MKNNIILILFLYYSPILLFGQGSGNLLHLDDSDDYVNINGVNSNNFTLSSNFTVEAWVKPDAITGGQQCVIHFGSWNNNDYGIIFGVAGDDLYFHIWNAPLNRFRSLTSSANILSISQPNHIAVTKSGNNVVLYHNGVSIATATNFTNFSTGQTLNSSIGREWQNNGDRGRQYNGQIDEVRVWNFAKTQTQLRDQMCSLEDGTSPGLLGCWNFDEGSGTTANDISTGSNNGTLINFALTGSTSNWLLSHFPIGNTSSYNYPASANWTGQTVNLTSTSRGNFEVNTVTGSPTGIHVYRVDEVPNSVTNITPTLGSSDLYYGTFLVNGTSPTYTAEYNYTNYADAIAQEPDLLIYNRDDNSDPTWIDITATINPTLNTLTETSIATRGEFIIAGSSGPLPIELLYLNTNILGKTVEIEWQTASETNNDYFTIERSIDGTSWEEIKRIDGAGNSSTSLNYSVVDKNPFTGISYYRLKQTDFDGNYSYSQIKSINFNTLEQLSLSIYPNPTNNIITVEGADAETITIYNVLGKNVTALTKMILNSETKTAFDLSQLNTGVYFIKTKTTTNKIYKQ